MKEVRFQPQWLLAIRGTASLGQLTRQAQAVSPAKESHPAPPALGVERARNVRHHQHRSHLPFSLILSPPLARPLQLSAQTVFPLAQTTAPPSHPCVPMPAVTRNMHLPKASQSLPSLGPPLPYRPSICLILPQAPTPLPYHQMPAQLQPPHRPVVAQRPDGPEPLLHDPQQPPVHWQQGPLNCTISGSVRRTHSTGKLLPLLLNPTRDQQKALVLPDPRPLAMASHLSNARCSQISTFQ